MGGRFRGGTGASFPFLLSWDLHIKIRSATYIAFLFFLESRGLSSAQLTLPSFLSSDFSTGSHFGLVELVGLGGGLG